MVPYRLFFLNASSGRVERAEIVEAADDEDAVQFCDDGPRYQDAELWCGARRVHCFSTKPEAVVLLAR